MRKNIFFLLLGIFVTCFASENTNSCVVRWARQQVFYDTVVQEHIEGKLRSKWGYDIFGRNWQILTRQRFTHIPADQRSLEQQKSYDRVMEQLLYKAVARTMKALRSEEQPHSVKHRLGGMKK